jgi:hypothetical protein
MEAFIAGVALLKSPNAWWRFVSNLMLASNISWLADLNSFGAHQFISLVYG